MKNKVRFITLGCKVNQYETQGMREALEKSGIYEDAGENPSCDYVVINTCTVTGEADKTNRYWIRRARREHPGAKIVVTGCYVEKNRAEIEAIPEVDLVLSNQAKAEIAKYLMVSCASPLTQDETLDLSLRSNPGFETEIASSSANKSWRTPRNDSKVVGFDLPRHQFTPLVISHTEGHGRAYVKIQDGCNHACSFCKVVLVRGRSRSRGLFDIIEEVKRLADSGYREMVFAGIQLGAYGLDLENKLCLPDVLEACAKIEGVERLRLSSIEPTDVKEELIEALRDIPQCCHHLHIPLQSGDDEVLKLMNRRYPRAFYRDLIFRLKSAMPDFSLTLDVMAGFPGEEEIHFQNTVDLLKEINPLKCHVFPYSRREGTRAAQLNDCAPQIIRDRVERLIRLGEDLGHEIRRRYEGKTLPVLVEKKLENSGLIQGLTPNYLKVYFEGNEEDIGKIFPVELLTLQGDIFLGKKLKENAHV
ncbi:MAG: tRNA (N(6)-L-threonylcarbamoyladenosine(37)-C(2))-methylthiotransferase MtaB [Candidatus Omnitrophica bacterium]|nr:tRNA (N(6)-L-threonylcarbamoyladenosine(37)-C(2))-methylthiotransferase MtaB [Candidatus Omnitrophota bacterium]